MFGCIGHVHVTEEKRKKLDDKSFMCIFLGVNEESKAFLMYDPVSKKIFISRDVIFEEEGKWSWKRNGEETHCTDLKWEDEGKRGEPKLEENKEREENESEYSN